MSSFKRRTPSKQGPQGTRSCSISPSTVLTSSGIPSLDDLLGGGVPLSCSLAILAPDSHSAYGELVQKYFVAQGIANNHKVCIVHQSVLSFAKECMWIPPNRHIPIPDEDDAIQNGDKIKIAWRYEQMKKFETTVTKSADHFCDAFDLTCRIPMSVIDEAINAKRFVPLNLTTSDDLAPSVDEHLRRIQHVLATSPPSEVVRLCVANLGSPDWGRLSASDSLRFLRGLHRLLRRYPHACACISFAPHFCTDHWAGTGWIQKIGWLTDATISMSGFGANPALTTLFPSHHGLVQIQKLPAPHSIIPTSDKYSTLRGLSSSAAANIGAGENNLAFKCTRKRLIFETMHLDVEGGVTERRTTPSSTTISLDVGLVHTHVTDKTSAAGLASVAVELEEPFANAKRYSLEGHVSSQNSESGAAGMNSEKVKKGKKKVAFHSDKPDLYDF
ncbi:PAXNEB-domain-containing protein [Chiua virens]|nr:PAXNEB-domain-containing protein [Chiua virens]